MFTNFFLELRQAKVPVSIKEYLTLMEAHGARTSPTAASTTSTTCRAPCW